jgi:hypothetical protein
MAGSSAQAAEILGLDLQFSKSLELKDAIGFAKNSGSSENPDARGMVAGLFTGSIMHLHDKVDPTYRLVGFGGFTFYASSAVDQDGGVKWLWVFNPISFWNDSAHIDIGRNMNDEGYTLGFGLSALDAGRLLTNGVTSVFTRMSGGA